MTYMVSTTLYCRVVCARHMVIYIYGCRRDSTTLRHDVSSSVFVRCILYTQYGSLSKSALCGECLAVLWLVVAITCMYYTV